MDFFTIYFLEQFKKDRVAKWPVVPCEFYSMSKPLKLITLFILGQSSLILETRVKQPFFAACGEGLGVVQSSNDMTCGVCNSGFYLKGEVCESCGENTHSTGDRDSIRTCGSFHSLFTLTEVEFDSNKLAKSINFSKMTSYKIIALAFSFTQSEWLFVVNLHKALLNWWHLIAPGFLKYFKKMASWT